MIFKFRIVFAQGRKRVCMESGKTDEWAEKWIRLNKNVADRKQRKQLFLFYFKFDTPMKNAHLNRIVDQHRHQQTDRLYGPLRQALNKRSSSRQKYPQRYLSPQPFRQLKHSVISHKLCQITPSQAQEMQNQIYIPTARKLIPTTERQRIEGKKFVAVDINVQYSQPIPEAEFKQKVKERKGPTYIQTVYTLSSTPTRQTPSSLQSPRLNIKSLQKGASNQQFLGEKVPEETLQASPPKLKNQPFFEDQQQAPLQPTRKQRYSNYRKQLNDSDLTSEGIGRHLGKQRPKSQYKYNLFSILDEATNTKCSRCWVGNQLIASKPTRQSWY